MKPTNASRGGSPTARKVVLLAALCAAVVGAVGCAGSQTADDEKGEAVSGQPPENPEPVEPEDIPGASVSVDEVADSADSEADDKADDTSEDKPNADAVAKPEEIPEGAETVSRTEVRELLERGPAYILQSVRVEPHREGGDFAGFEIVAATQGALDVLRPQMQIGDVIVTINDVEIIRPDDYLGVWKSLNRVDRVRIQFERDDESHSAVWIIQDGESR